MADAEARRLAAVLDSPGPGLLVLPMFAPRMAHVTGFSLSRAKDRAGFVRADIQFLDAAAAPGFAPGLTFNAAISAFDGLTISITASVQA